MNSHSFRDTWVEVSLAAIKQNTEQYKDFIGANVKLMAVVKADGYGHGAVEVAKTVIRGGAEYLAVAFLDEAMQLRNAGVKQPILVLGYTPVRSIKEAIVANIDLTVFSKETLDEIIFQAEQLHKSVSVHLKVDTGMSRIGVQNAEDALVIAEKIITNPFVYLKGIFTHFANADSNDPSFTYEQYGQFQKVISHLEDCGIHIPLKHCCNTAGTMIFPDMHLDMVRVGIGLYGLYPDPSLKSHVITLKQAMALKTKVAALKIVPAARPISYGCTNAPKKDSIIATLPIGYADGLSRLLSNCGQFLLDGHKVPVMGRVCMDQTMVNVSEIPECKLGDVITIFGSDNEAFQSVDEIADLMGTINYETVCLIGKRVPRIYHFSDRKLHNSSSCATFSI
ncbi:alanine racemase [Neobacillus sp. LXY-4]|uniref:alanine racemase n=1 Tax=Neobacillus sp. LXY-4 TaxID=3379826 RepID=UPI003EE24A8B